MTVRRIPVGRCCILPLLEIRSSALMNADYMMQVYTERIEQRYLRPILSD